MGWGSCGTDSKGRPIGYAHEGICDHEGCDAEIDRGLAFACGGMHGEDECGCEGYFCIQHLTLADDDHCKDQLCITCASLINEAHKEIQEGSDAE